MSRKTSLILSVLLIVSFVLTACGAPAATQAPATQAPAHPGTRGHRGPGNASTQRPSARGKSHHRMVAYYHHRPRQDPLAGYGQ